MSVRSNVDRAGLNERISLQRKSVVLEDEGAHRDVWSELGTCWAKADAIKAGERYRDAKVTQVDGYTLWIRAEVFQHYGLTTNDRVEWRGRFLDISDIPDQQLRGRLVALFCVGGLNNG